MLVSVIIPVYNVEKYIEKCVRSVLAQTFRNFEIIVVIDGSTDTSEKIIRDIQTEYPDEIRIINQERKGPGAARNAGISVASGEYLLFVDSDDYISPDLLELIYRQASSTECDIIAFDAEHVDDRGNRLKYEQAIPGNGDVVSLDNSSRLLMLPCLWNKLYKKDLFTDNKITVPEGITMGEDLATNIKLISAANKIVYFDKPLYYYVRHSGSITATVQSDRNIVLRNRDIILSYENAVEYLKKIGKYQEYTAELEYIAVYHILFTATMRVNECDSRNKLQAELVDYTLKKYPHFEKNRYYKCLLSRKDKISIWFLKHKLFRTLHFVLKLNRKLTGR